MIAAVRALLMGWLDLLRPRVFGVLAAGVGLTIGLLLALLAVGGPRGAVRAVVVLLALELAQGLVGFVQYATDLPVVLVGVHLLGAALISAALARTLLMVRRQRA